MGNIIGTLIGIVVFAAAVAMAIFIVKGRLNKEIDNLREAILEELKKVKK